MKATVTRIEFENDTVIATCDTSIGELKGLWIYDDNPAIGETYHVELTMEELLGTPVFDAVQEYQVSMENETVFFRGMCEGADEEVLYIRFDIDWIEMIDIVDGIKAGDFVAFSAHYKKVQIYPYEL